MSDPWALAAIFAALAMGGFLKGAIGLGTPVLAIPVMSAIFDVRTAVVLMVLPNLITNILQFWCHHRRILGQGLYLRYAVGAAIGVAVGTVLLVRMSGAALSLAVAAALVAFILLRLTRPDWQLSHSAADKLAAPMGTLAGLLQGAAGLSAPVMVGYFNAMRLERLVFLPAASAAFLAMGLTQLPMMTAMGLMTPELALVSLFALIPLLALMPVGAWVARRISAQAFDRILLIVLGLLALKLIWDALS